MTETNESLADLISRFSDPDAVPSTIARVSLTDALADGRDPLDILTYFARLGLPILTLDDLLKINAEPDEEEIRAFRVDEGVAVVVASESEWIVFTP